MRHVSNSRNEIRVIFPNTVHFNQILIWILYLFRLTKSDFREPVNIGSDEMVSMNEMAEIILSFESKNLPIHHIPGPEGVRGRNSDNTLIKEKLGWAPTMKLKVQHPLGGSTFGSIYCTNPLVWHSQKYPPSIFWYWCRMGWESHIFGSRNKLKKRNLRVLICRFMGRRRLWAHKHRFSLALFVLLMAKNEENEAKWFVFLW